MDRRLRRGKHLPPSPPPRPPMRESDSGESAEIDEDESSVEEEELVFVEGELESGTSKHKKAVQNMELEKAGTSRVQRQSVRTMEISDDEFQPPATPNIIIDDIDENNAPLELTNPSDLGDMFEELIQKCDSLEKASEFDDNFLREMCRNIKRGQELFEYIKKGTIEQASEDSGSNRRIAGPGGMYLAYLHAKMTSNLIRNRAEHIGSGNTIFTLDKYLSSLKTYYLNEDGFYCDKVASGCIAAESSHQTRTLNPLVAIAGAYDDELVYHQKVRKPRTQSRKQNDDDQQDASMDDGADSNAIQNLNSNPVAENIAKDMNKVLKQVYRERNRPVNLFEFTLDRSSFSKTVENIFYLSFLVKDGHVSLTKDENDRLKEYALNIKPEKAQSLKTASPEDDEDTRNQIHRQKYILSFSPLQWKQFCAISTGECTLAHFQEWLQRQQSLAIMDS